MILDESILEFQAKRVRDFELSSTLVFVCSAIKGQVYDIHVKKQWPPYLVKYRPFLHSLQ